MFWDGYRWSDTRASRRAQSASAPDPWSTWIATTLMLVLLVGIAVPLRKADAEVAVMSLSPSAGSAGDRVTARVDGLPAGTAVALEWDGEPVQHAQVAGKSGKLSIRFTVPHDAVGTHQVALMTSSTSRDRKALQMALAPGIILATALFTVLTPDSTLPAPSAPSSQSQSPAPSGSATATPSPTAIASTTAIASATPVGTPTPTPTATAAPTSTPAPTPAPIVTPAPPAPTPVPPPSPSCTVTFAGDASGAADVTAALQTFFQQAPAGATACLAAGGQYRVNGRIQVVARENGLTIEGNGARLLATVRSNSALLMFAGGRNLVVRNLTIEGHNPNGRTSNAHEYAWEFGMGISLYGVINATVANVSILNVNGDAVYVDGGNAGAGYRWSDGVAIRNVLIDGTGRHGVAFTNGVRNAVVSGSTIRLTGMYPVVIEPDGVVVGGATAGADGITITGNAISRYTIDSSWGPYLFAATGHGPENNIEFSNNVVTGQHLRIAVQPNGYARTNIRILNNRSDTRVAGPVMDFAGCTNLTVTGNVQPLSSGALATVSGCTNVNISNNTIN